MTRRISWIMGAAVCSILAAGCPPEDDKPRADAGRDADDESGAGSGGQSGGADNDGENAGQTAGDNDAACAAVLCEAGTQCQVTQVECVKAPCEPVVECVPNDVSGCELIDCLPSHRCVEDAKGAGSCVPNDGGKECALDCEKGKHCENVEVTCVQAPCDRVPECVADDVCTGVKCDPGKLCKVVYPPCAQPPDGMIPPSCEPQPVCMTGTPCGKNTCTGGQECCNSSCGTCVTPGMSCIQIICPAM